MIGGSSSQLSPSSAVSPCGACKFLRRKCTKTCVFAPYFPPDQGQRFANVHKIFGASNVAKLLSELPTQKREDAVNSLSYEADARVNDPVYGCVGALFVLQQQVSRLQSELAVAQAEIARFHLLLAGGQPGPLPSQRGGGVGSFEALPLDVASTRMKEEQGSFGPTSHPSLGLAPGFFDARGLQAGGGVPAGLQQGLSLSPGLQLQPQQLQSPQQGALSMGNMPQLREVGLTPQGHFVQNTQGHGQGGPLTLQQQQPSDTQDMAELQALARAFLHGADDRSIRDGMLGSHLGR